MFSKMKTGWTLAKQSLAVIKSDKELLLFPMISGIALVIVTLSFIAPFFSESFLHFFETNNEQLSAFAYIYAFLFYFVNYFIILFFNAALIGCAIIRFNGGDPTFKDGLDTASKCLPQIISWSLISATVGLILKVVESRFEKAGAIISAILGAAWSIGTYFVLPVLVIEKTGPLDAIQRSKDILKKTWGEALTANLGLGLITFGLMLLSFIPFILGVMIGTSLSMITGGVITIISFIVVSLISTAADTIIIAAVYQYTNGNAPQQFDNDLLEHAFK